MLRKIGRFIYYNLFFLTPLLVLSTTSELFELNKMNLIYASSVSIFSIIVFSMIRTRKIVVPRLPFQIPYFIFLTVITASFLFSIDRHVSWFGYYGRFNGGLLSMLAYGVIMYGVVYFFTAKDLRSILTTTLLSSTVVLIWGLPGLFGRDLSCLLFAGQFNNSCWTDHFRPAERMFSTLGQPNWLGAYFAIHFFIGLYALLSNHWKRWYLSYGYLLLIWIGLLATKSRSALLAVGIAASVFGVAIWWAGLRETLSPHKKRLVVLGFLGLVAVLILKTGIERVDRVLNLPARSVKTVSTPVAVRPLSSEVTESLDIRKIVWRGAIDLLRRYPVLGTGPETFAIGYTFVRPPEHNLTSEWDYIYNKAHNEYLNYAATTGGIGLITYLAFVLAVLIYLHSMVKDADPGIRLVSATFLAAYVTILVTNFFGFSTSVIQLFFFLLPPLLLLASGRGAIDLVSRARSAQVIPIQKLQTACVVIFFLFCQSWILMFFIADTQYAQALVYEANDDIVTAYKHLHTAESLHHEPVYLDKLSNYEANLALIAASQGKNDIAEKSLQQSQLHGAQVLKSSPYNVQFWKTNAKNNLIYYQLTSNQQYLFDGLKAIQTSMTIAPTDPKLPYSEAVYYSVLSSEAKKSTEKATFTRLARESLDDALALKPNYEAAKVFRAKVSTE